MELRDQRIAELEAQVVHLESPEHREKIILEWLNTLDQESYYALGVRKGYLEEINPPAEKTTPVELREPDPNEFKQAVAEQLKQIREGNARLIEQMFSQNKDVIIQSFNQNLTEQLKNLSPAGISGGTGPMDKYLPIIEKVFGANQSQPEDFPDKLEGILT